MLTPKIASRFHLLYIWLAAIDNLKLIQGFNGGLGLLFFKRRTMVVNDFPPLIEPPQD